MFQIDANFATYVAIISAVMGLVLLGFTPLMSFFLVRNPSVWYNRVFAVVSALVVYPPTRFTALIGVACLLMLFLMWSNLVRKWATSFKKEAETEGLTDECEPYFIALAERFVGPIEVKVDGYPLAVLYACA